eukprot:355687-Rhodomonas_salina.3
MKSSSLVTLQSYSTIFTSLAPSSTLRRARQSAPKQAAVSHGTARMSAPTGEGRACRVNGCGAEGGWGSLVDKLFVPDRVERSADHLGLVPLALANRDRTERV